MIGRRLAGDLTEAASGNGSSLPPRKAGLYSKNETSLLASQDKRPIFLSQSIIFKELAIMTSYVYELSFLPSRGMQMVVNQA